MGGSPNFRQFYRVQSADHHVQANLAAAKATTHVMRNRKIETAKLACFLNSLKLSLIRGVRREKTERRKRNIGTAAAMKPIILRSICQHPAIDRNSCKARLR
jgi:hypothetical protein